MRVVRWQGGKGGRIVRWHGERFLGLFEGGGLRVSPRFHLLFLMLINETKEQGVFKIFLRGRWDGKILLGSNARY